MPSSSAKRCMTLVSMATVASASSWASFSTSPAPRRPPPMVPRRPPPAALVADAENGDAARGDLGNCGAATAALRDNGAHTAGMGAAVESAAAAVVATLAGADVVTATAATSALDGEAVAKLATVAAAAAAAVVVVVVAEMWLAAVRGLAERDDVGDSATAVLACRSGGASPTSLAVDPLAFSAGPPPPPPPPLSPPPPPPPAPLPPPPLTPPSFLALPRLRLWRCLASSRRPLRFDDSRCSPSLSLSAECALAASDDAPLSPTWSPSTGASVARTDACSSRLRVARLCGDARLPLPAPLTPRLPPLLDR
mmetsp:Transcript_15163/g.37519  ORF Transcript_15163/g.37519 Transcript_15163/m.37519 type:complete len:310 (+) Transcript_15163:703-1632(+)